LPSAEATFRNTLLQTHGRGTLIPYTLQAQAAYPALFYIFRTAQQWSPVVGPPHTPPPPPEHKRVHPPQTTRCRAPIALSVLLLLLLGRGLLLLMPQASGDKYTGANTRQQAHLSSPQYPRMRPSHRLFGKVPIDLWDTQIPMIPFPCDSALFSVPLRTTHAPSIF
jgi:hypothetical protein